MGSLLLKVVFVFFESSAFLVELVKQILLLSLLILYLSFELDNDSILISNLHCQALLFY